VRSAGSKPLVQLRKTDPSWRSTLWLITLSLIAACAWALVFSRYFLEQKPRLAGGLSEVQLQGLTEQWLGFYQGDSPIGYNHLVIEPRGNEYFMTDEMVLRVNLLGQVNEMRLFMKGRLDMDWTIQSLDFDLSSEGLSFSARAQRVNNLMKIIIRTGGERLEREISLNQPPYLYTEPVLAEKLRQQGIKPGLKLSVPVFEPLTQSFDLVNLEVQEKERVKLAKGEVDAFKVSESFRQQTEYLWITETGEVVKEWHPSGFTALKIDRDTALNLLTSEGTGLNPDLISALSVPSDRYIENSRQVKFLKLRIKGAKLDGLDLDGDGQKLSGRTLEILGAEVSESSYALPFSGDLDMEKYLKPDWQVQSDSEGIVSQAREIVGSEKDSVKATAMLVQWVSRYVEDSLVVSIPSALEVLKSRRGACKEHTVLFTALARSAGIPARMVAGLVYSDAYLIKGFYYHAWAEVYLTDEDGKNGRWVRVDPTFNQFPADATHIRLKIGNLEDMLSLMQVVGQTRIEVIEYQ